MGFFRRRTTMSNNMSSWVFVNQISSFSWEHTMTDVIMKQILNSMVLFMQSFVKKYEKLFFLISNTLLFYFQFNFELFPMKFLIFICNSNFFLSHFFHLIWMKLEKGSCRKVVDRTRVRKYRKEHVNLSIVRSNLFEKKLVYTFLHPRTHICIVIFSENITSLSWFL